LNTGKRRGSLSSRVTRVNRFGDTRRLDETTAEDDNGREHRDDGDHNAELDEAEAPTHPATKTTTARTTTNDCLDHSFLRGAGHCKKPMRL
jgi:hypothetical protein